LKIVLWCNRETFLPLEQKTIGSNPIGTANLKIETMAKRVKDESKVIGIVYFCDKLKKELMTTDISSLSSTSQECDICGSHGSTTLFVTNCECGEYHDITITSW
jgi:hypothetical protein